MRKRMIVLLLLFSLPCISIFAQKNSVSDLETKVKVLEQRVYELEEIVVELGRAVIELSFESAEAFSALAESGSRSSVDATRNYPEPTPAAKLPLSADREAWRKLEFGMDEEEVIRLLDEPLKINTYSPDMIIWSYPNGGSIDFDSNGVDSWSEPY